MSDHLHVAKIIAWKFDKDFNHIPAKYGCTGCDKEFFEVPKSKFSNEHTHTEYVDGCFACKVTTLELSPGDAASNKSMSKKKWDGELELYRTARAQGIQPDGTSRAKIEKAIDVSNQTGYAYGSPLGA
jgi:hypothetical protein